jgi:hypothetical protein
VKVKPPDKVVWFKLDEYLVRSSAQMNVVSHRSSCVNRLIKSGRLLAKVCIGGVLGVFDVEIGRSRKG